MAWVLLLASCAFGQLAGTVRDSVSKLPVAGVKIHLGKQTAESTATGEFQIDDLKPGKYKLYFNRDGYENGNAPVEVTADAVRVTLDIKPLGEMEGAIRGEDGKPLEGIGVYLGGLRYTTDKDGRYDVQAIPGGKYSLTLRVPYELRRQTMIRDKVRGETFGYVDQKLPTPVTIASGAHVTNFDIDLRRGRLVDVKGKVVDALAATEVELDSAKGLPEAGYGKRRLDPQAGFRFDLLEPGDYTVVVHRNQEGDDLPYLAPVHLGDAGLQDLEVVLPPFARIEGTVRTPHADLAWAGTLRVMLGRAGYDTEVRVGPEGRFALHAIPPGEWNLVIDTKLTHRADDVARRMYVIAPVASLRVTESGNPPLELLLTDVPGKITGTVAEPGVVILMQVSGTLSTMQTVQVAPDGSFSAEVGPGEYTVAFANSTPCALMPERVAVQSGASVSVHLKLCAASGQ
jgi:hypothetical protein